MSILQPIVLIASLGLAIIWVSRSRAPQAIAVKLRAVAPELEELLQRRRRVAR